jgi:chemotaxis protein histidine kinase CheA
MLRLQTVVKNSVPIVSNAPTGIIVILDTSVGVRAILVDDVLGKQEVIIKNLGDAFANQTLIGGGAIMADGRVALILDAETLARLPTISPGRLSREVA